MNKNKPTDREILIILWPVLTGFAFIILLYFGEKIAALLIGLSGVIALPSSTEALKRYSVDGTKRIYICAGLAVLSFTLAFPDRSETQSDIVATLTEQSDPAIAAGETSAIDQATEANEEHDLVDISDCRAVDGDTLKCGQEAVRLLGIDAPEMAGHCAVGRNCVEGDPVASRDNLQFAIQYVMQIERVGEDRYGRTLAMVYVDGESLSCQQLRANHAVYVSDWDDGQRVANGCQLKAG